MKNVQSFEFGESSRFQSIDEAMEWVDSLIQNKEYTLLSEMMEEETEESIHDEVIYIYHYLQNHASREKLEQIFADLGVPELKKCFLRKMIKISAAERQHNFNVGTSDYCTRVENWKKIDLILLSIQRVKKDI